MRQLTGPPLSCLRQFRTHSLYPSQWMSSTLLGLKGSQSRFRRKKMKRHLVCKMTRTKVLSSHSRKNNPIKMSRQKKNNDITFH